MNNLQATTVMIALFALRCIVPLLLTVGLVRLMNRLVERWTAEEAAREQGALGGTPLVSRPAIPVTSATPTPSFSCWLLRNCDETRRAGCPAYRRQSIPCWQARLMEEGKLPAGCQTCPGFAAA